MGDQYSDKETERKRYNARADVDLACGSSTTQLGAYGISAAIRSPYLAYESKLRANLAPGMRVLELGAGSGGHTEVLVASKAQVIATDISERSLEFMRQRFRLSGEDLQVAAADIERLPFGCGVFDVVCAAGVLSYGDNILVMEEVYRVLKPGGVFICVDSLNGNPVYRLNRWVHYLRGERSKSTLVRMPSLKLLSAYERRFLESSTYFFGGLSFMAPIFTMVLGGDRAGMLSDWFDAFFRVKRFAFKFVMIAKKG